MRYRYEVPAWICFDVIAETEDEAKAKAREIVLTNDLGFDVAADDELDMRAYFANDAEDKIELIDLEADCPECARSYGPHYRGPCEHGG
jgi:hypothetical protein